MLLQQLGDLDEARTAVERALRIFEAAYGPDHPNTRTAADNLRGEEPPIGVASPAMAAPQAVCYPGRREQIWPENSGRLVNPFDASTEKFDRTWVSVAGWAPLGTTAAASTPTATRSRTAR